MHEVRRDFSFIVKVNWVNNEFQEGLNNEERLPESPENPRSCRVQAVADECTFRAGDIRNSEQGRVQQRYSVCIYKQAYVIIDATLDCEQANVSKSIVPYELIY